MKSLTIKIKFGNEEMQDCSQAMLAIHNALQGQIEYPNCPTEPNEGHIKDTNGNTVGTWVVK